MLRSTLSPWFATLVLLLVPAATSIGCGGGGGGSKRSSNTPAAPDPGGVVGPISTVTTAVSASLTLGAYRDFRPQVSLSDIELPDAPGLRDHAFVVEDDGVVRVLSLTAQGPVLQRAIQVDASTFGAGVATGGLTIQDEHTALLTSSGSGGENVYVFDPSTALGPSDVAKVELSSLTVTWPAGTLNSAGDDVGGQALPINFTAGAALAGGRLHVVSSNFDAQFNNLPGTVTCFPWDANTRTVTGAPLVIRTTDFNPVAITRVVTTAGEVLLVTNAGAFGGTSSIDVLDPVGQQVVATIPLGQRSAAGPVVVSPDQRRGYVGSQSAAEVYVLDLSDLGAELQNQAPASRPARFLGGWILPAPGAFRYVSSVALSHTGDYLYAASFNSSQLFVIDLERQALAATVAGFARTGNPTNFEGLASLVAVRPGVPGLDFQGPSIFVGTINLAAADRTIPDVEVVLDAVTVDRH